MKFIVRFVSGSTDFAIQMDESTKVKQLKKFILANLTDKPPSYKHIKLILNGKILLDNAYLASSLFASKQSLPNLQSSSKQPSISITQSHDDVDGVIHCIINFGKHTLV